MLDPNLLGRSWPEAPGEHIDSAQDDEAYTVGQAKTSDNPKLLEELRRPALI